jgi:uncharacterized protein (TIGR02611 family)
VIGGIVIVAGVVVSFIPGPGGLLVILLGLAILATEFRWARRLRRWVNREARSLTRRLTAKGRPQSELYREKNGAPS